jgi:hypothetical protein
MVAIGTDAQGTKLTLSDRDRSGHIHVLGKTRSGKSNLLEYMARQDIAGGRRGLCLIDPHGYLSDDIEAWCAARGLGRTRRIHLVKPGDPAWTAGFNPMRLRPGEAPSKRVDMMVAACVQVWGGNDMAQTPRLRRILRALFFALSVQDLTLAEALLFLRSHDTDGMRRSLTAALPDPTYDFIWQELNALSRREFSEMTESTVSRVAAFLDSPAVRLMVGQQAHSLDFRKVMDEGDIVLVNLGSRNAFSRENARVVGSLIISDLFLTALGRDARVARAKPFSLYIDEAYDFLTSDIEGMLDQTAKFGLHVVLAHQHLSQLHKAGVYDAVMASTRTKIAFNIGEDDSAVMTKELFRDQLDLERPKHALDKPVVVGSAPHHYVSQSVTETAGGSDGDSESSGWGSSESATDTVSDGYRLSASEPPEPWSLAESRGRSVSASASGGRGSFHSSSWSRSETRSVQEGTQDVRDWLPTATYSLEELFHEGQVKLGTLQVGQAYVKCWEGSSRLVEVPRMAPVLSSTAMLRRFREGVNVRSQYLVTTAAAGDELALRQAQLRSVPPTREEAAEFWAVG